MTLVNQMRVDFAEAIGVLTGRVIRLLIYRLSIYLFIYFAAPYRKHEQTSFVLDVLLVLYSTFSRLNVYSLNEER